MTRWILAGTGLGAAVIAALFATAVLGGERNEPAAPAMTTVSAHPMSAPAPAAASAAKAASLFKVVYKETDPISIPAGVTPYRLGSCPRGGAVLSAWHIRIGDDRSGLVAGGSRPVGVREVDYVVANTTGGAVNGRLGLICIK